MNYEQHTMYHTTQGFVRRFNRNNSLITNLELIFTHLCENFKIIFKYQSAAHFFVNENLPQVDFMFKSNNNQIITSNGNSYIKYEQINFQSPHADVYLLFQRLQNYSSCSDIPDFHKADKGDLEKIFRFLNVASASGIENINDQPNIIIPFKLSFLNLGFFLLWDKEKDTHKRIEESELAAWIASQYYFLKEFLIGEYGNMNRRTYLPSLYTARWKRIAVLFADIMNFNLLFENIGVTYGCGEEGKTTILRTILNKYCEEMAIVVQQKGQGRIANFFGTQIMAIFGEHEDEPTEAVGNTLYAARKMIERFNELKTDFLQNAYGPDYQIEYNEDVNLNLKIGIDFGNVLFDYLGDDNHREYTAIGSHVEFAKFLNSETLKADGKNSNDISIIISKTANRCVLPWLLPEHKKELTVYDAEKGRYYDVYNVLNFDEKYFLDCREHRRWGDAWNNQNFSKP